MAESRLLNTSAAAQFWKSRYERQGLLIGSITSLFNKYGSSLEPDQLQRAFLLTLMGHYVAGDACYYEREADEMVARRAYGRLNVAGLPRFPAVGKAVALLLDRKKPVRMIGLDEDVKREISVLSERFAVFSPLCVQDQLVGIAFLGPKVDGSGYTSFDLDVLHALCGASALTFNNAMLCGNARLAAEEIRKIYLVRSELIDRITHEFRTPLTVIKGAVELISATETAREIGESLVAAATRLEALTEDLLQLKGGIVDEALESIQGNGVARIVQDVTSRFLAAAGVNGIRVVFRGESEVDRCTIAASPKALMDAIEVLVDNAIKYSPPSTTVTVSVETAAAPNAAMDGIRLSDWKGHADELISAYDSATSGPPTGGAQGAREDVLGYLVVRVSDSGIGIPDLDIDMLGEPFRQASNSPESGVKGKALGLARAYRSITRWNGDIFCRSEEGIGTIFSVFLPLATRSRRTR